MNILIVILCVYQPIKDRKSTRLNSSHANISYAVFCLKKKTLYESSSCASFPSAKNATITPVLVLRICLPPTTVSSSSSPYLKPLSTPKFPPPPTHRHI